jgi:beta-phosphoglucomutase-like phosphatase (HAD superfamily)
VTAVDAVVFDLDGVLVDSEHIWDEVREELARERGGHWHKRAQADMIGMSSPERAHQMHPSNARLIASEVVALARA